MPAKTTVLPSDLTSHLVYPAALVPHAFSPGRDVSYSRQNRMPLYTHLMYPAASRSTEIALSNLPHSVLVMVMSGKTAVLLSDLTSSLVYLAALVPHAFSPGGDVSYAWQNRMPPCTNLAYSESAAFIHQH